MKTGNSDIYADYMNNFEEFWRRKLNKEETFSEYILNGRRFQIYGCFERINLFVPHFILNSEQFALDSRIFVEARFFLKIKPP